MKPSAGATSVNGRAEIEVRALRWRPERRLPGSVAGRHASASATTGGDRGVDEVQHVVVQDTRSFERRAKRALDQRADGGAGDDGERSPTPGSGRTPTPTAASASAASTPAAVPSSDIAPGVPGFTRLKVVTRNVERPHALPISLATVSLPPAVSAATSASSAVRRVRRRQRDDRGDRRDAAVGDRVAGAAASATLFGDAEHDLALQPEPRGDRCGEERREQQHPRAGAAADIDDRADDGAGDRAGQRHALRAGSRAPPSAR